MSSSKHLEQDNYFIMGQIIGQVQAGRSRSCGGGGRDNRTRETMIPAKSFGGLREDEINGSHQLINRLTE